jgi:hypothetical protein
VPYSALIRNASFIFVPFLARVGFTAANRPFVIPQQAGMKSGQSLDHSQPFLLRVWKEEGEEGAVAWCGKLQHIVNGDSHLFRDWATLAALLEASFQNVDDPEQTSATGSGNDE